MIDLVGLVHPHIFKHVDPFQQEEKTDVHISFKVQSVSIYSSSMPRFYFNTLMKNQPIPTGKLFKAKWSIETKTFPSLMWNSDFFASRIFQDSKNHNLIFHFEGMLYQKATTTQVQRKLKQYESWDDTNETKNAMKTCFKQQQNKITFFVYSLFETFRRHLSDDEFDKLVHQFGFPKERQHIHMIFCKTETNDDDVCAVMRHCKVSRREALFGLKTKRDNVLDAILFLKK